MSLDYAKYRLTEWGRWSRDPPALMSSWKLIFGRSPTDKASMPAHVEEIDGIVRRIEPRPRIVLIVHYCRTGSGREKAMMAGIPQSTYFRQLDVAHWFVHTELDAVGQKLHISVHPDQAVSRASL